MRLEQFEFVMEVASQKSMIKASENLHTSVQNVSKGIKQLEEELNIQIFVRNKHGVFLTEDGEDICREAASIIQATHHLKEKYINKNAINDGISFEHLNLLVAHASSSFAEDMLEKLCLKYHPKSASILRMDALDINKKISADAKGLFQDYDMVVTNMLQSELDTNRKKVDAKNVFFLRKDRLGVRVHLDSPFANLPAVAVKDIIAEPLILSTPDGKTYSHLQMAVETMGVAIQPRYFVNTSEACTRYVDNGMGFCFATYNDEWLDEKEIRGKNSIVIPLKEKVFVTHILAVSDSFKSTEAYAYAIRQFKKEYAGMRLLS